MSYGQTSVALSPSGGPPTTKVQVSGTGFQPNSEVDVYFDVKFEALAISDGSGGFSNVDVNTPNSALPGKHWISAVQKSGGTGAQSPFWVHTNWSQDGFDATHAQWNRYENVLNAKTINRLTQQWSYASSGPAAVVQNAVYFGSGDTVYAINATSGQSLWQYATGGNISGTPAVNGTTLYAGSGDFNVYALSTTNGSLLWKYTTGSYVVAPPTVENGTVYVSSDDSNVYALNGTDGSLLWKFVTGGPVQFSPSVANGVVYIPSSDGNIYAVDATDGSQLWKYMTTPTNNSSTPSVVDGVAYVASADNNLYALNASNGNLLWKTNLGAPADGSTAAVANGVVYVGSGDAGVFYAINSNNGSIRWTYTTKVPVYSASAVANGLVYFGDGSGNFYSLDANSGALRWKYVTTGFFPSGVVTNGKVYLSADKFYVFDIPGLSNREVPPPSLISWRTRLENKLES